MQELQPRFLQVGDILFEADIQQEYEIHRVTPKFAVCIDCEPKKYFRKELCRNNGVWKTCLKGDKFDAFILNENI